MSAAPRRTVQISLLRVLVSAVLLYALSSSTLPPHLISNLIIILAVAVSRVLAKFFGYRRVGFFCDDASIRYAFKPETITTFMLLSGCYAIAFALILLAEALRICCSSSSETVQYQWRGKNVHPFLVRLVKYFGYFQVGFIFMCLLCMITKRAVGRLRPNFFAVCKPIQYSCSGSAYITEYECEEDNLNEVSNSRSSFYSGHSVLAVYTAVYLMLYLRSQVCSVTKCRVPVALIEMCLLAGALYVAYTRLHDNMHHPSDIAVGIIVGILGGAYTAVLWAGMFRGEEQKRSSDSSNLLDADDLAQSYPILKSPRQDMKL